MPGLAARDDRPKASTMRRLLFIALLAPAAALAQDPSQGTGPQPSPNVAPAAIPICTDRPTKADVACTVPKGNVQIEAALIDWTRMRVDGTRTDTLVYADPVVKLGVGTHTDVEVGLPFYSTVRTRNAGGVYTRDGVGDLTLRVKQRLTADKAKTQVSLIPYVLAPTAPSGVGEGGWEGGVAAPIDVPLPLKLTLALEPTVSIVTDDAGPGHHAAITMLTQLSHGVGKQANLYAELWTRQDLDPDGHTAQYSADLAATYSLTKTLQLDAGANLGLNRITPGLQLYLGVSTRF